MKYERGFFVEEVHSPLFRGDVIEYFRSGCELGIDNFSSASVNTPDILQA